jgi:hypothetical protein
LRLEATLGQATLQRHLAAFKADFVITAGTRLLTFVTTACGFAQTGADTTADATPRTLGTVGGLDGIELHDVPPLRES